MKAILKRGLPLVLCFCLLFLNVSNTYAICTQPEVSEAEYINAELLPILSNALKINFDSMVVGEVTSWIKLYDTNLTYYAYFVPLYNQVFDLSGYSIITDINSNHTVLATGVGDVASNYAKCIMDLAVKKQNCKIIYVFPESFILYNANSFHLINLDGELSTIENVSNIETNTVQILSQNEQKDFSTLSMNDSYLLGSLKHWGLGDFVPVNDGSSIWYGGWQKWLLDEGKTKEEKNRSCGVTAAANVLYYMSKYASGKSNLYNQKGITKPEFSKFQSNLYDNGLEPSLIGILDGGQLISGVYKWASLRKVSLTAVTLDAEFTPQNLLTHMVQGLASDCPVLLVTWNSSIPDLVNHWVTITRMYTTGSSIKMVASTWGEQREYDFTVWANDSSIYKEVLYFK